MLSKFNLLVLIFLFSGFQALANVQRLGIPAGTESIILERKGSTNFRRAFCLDRHLSIDEPVTFTKVLGGDAKIVKIGNLPLMSLTQAIKSGFIKIEGSGIRDNEGFSDGTQLKFISETDQPVVINFPTVLALGEETASPVSLKILRSLKSVEGFKGFNSSRNKFTELEKDIFKENQDKIWFSGIDESRLEVLGFYGSGEVIRNSTTTVEAIKRLQKKLGFPQKQQTGTLTLKTKEGLEKLEQDEIKFFEERSFGVIRRDTNVKSLVDNIHSAERVLQIPEKERTGKVTETFKLKVKEFTSFNQNIINQVLNVSKNKLLPYEYSTNIDSNVVTFVRIPQLLKQQFPEFENFPDEYVLTNSSGKFELWGLSDGNLQNKIENKDSIIQALDFLSWYSNYFLSILGRNKNYLQFQATKNSDAEINLISPIFQSIKIQKSDFDKFMNGDISLPALDNLVNTIVSENGSNSTISVMRSSFSQNRNGIDGSKFLEPFGYKEVDPVKFAIAFNKRYGDKIQAVIGTDVLLSLRNLNTIPKIENGASITLFLDGKFKLSSEIITPIEEELKKAQLNIVSAGNNNKDANVTPIMLFANHSDPEFRVEILKLAEQGLFKNSIIALAVCGTGCDAQFNSLLIRKSGAKAIIFYNKNINAQATQDVLKSFGELLQQKGGKLEKDFQNLWRESVRKAEKEASTEELKIEIKKLLDSIFQVSALEKKETLEVVE